MLDKLKKKKLLESLNSSDIIKDRDKREEISNKLLREEIEHNQARFSEDYEDENDEQVKSKKKKR